jgi:hypothetical protein
MSHEHLAVPEVGLRSGTTGPCWVHPKVSRTSSHCSTLGDLSIKIGIPRKQCPLCKTGNRYTSIQEHVRMSVRGCVHCTCVHVTACVCMHVRMCAVCARMLMYLCVCMCVHMQSTPVCPYRSTHTHTRVRYKQGEGNISHSSYWEWKEHWD